MSQTTYTEQLFLRSQRKRKPIRGTGKRLTPEVLCSIEPKGELERVHEYQIKRQNFQMSLGGAA
ncbi:MAG: hypothetical protein CL583_01910 [Alteromonadaceae bacterium]|nr:hypothetical protein [Alteromonadaceae bacterium]|tara:strand:+ start:2856 stop:3047 length:192 start_codon:yes stop_codon:yes gene_type:complete